MTIKNLKAKFPNIRYVSIGHGEEEASLKNYQKNYL
jgi:hypothetical protein